MTKNVCFFVPFQNDNKSIHTINFVYETKDWQHDGLITDSVYKMYYVCSGKGVLHASNTTASISKGDVFFTFPGNEFSICSEKDFTYMYISFIGFRCNMILENLNINPQNFLFHNADNLYDIWKNGLSFSTTMSTIASESVLLYTFAYLGNQILTEPSAPELKHSVILIKKYIDENYTNHNFSVEQIGKDLSYNTKYVSSSFKKHFGIGIIEYLNTIRIQTACAMMKENFTSVSDIADKCGFSNTHYFSKIFKQKMNISPTQYINELTEKE